MHPSPAFISAALARWELDEGAKALLINHSENHTYRIDAPQGRFCLRVHRPGYQSTRSIASELAWLDALRRDTDLSLPRPAAGQDRRLLQTLPDGAGDRHAVLFEFIEGTEPTLGDDLVPTFEHLGHHAAHLHLHAEGWRPPQSFDRQAWDARQVLDPEGLWGDWRVAPAVDPAVREVLDRLDQRLRDDLNSYGTAHDRFGLIHADMRLGNLLVDGPTLSIIDFDDCGYCWFAYDFAAAVSFHEAEPAVRPLKEAWLRGYLPVRSLSDDDVAAMDTMVLLRRMALLAWIGSHRETALAQHHQPGFAAGTVVLAQRYLDERRLWV
jgi:Ser/Thr protein kinase RdoA (MazF antagonist)